MVGNFFGGQFFGGGFFGADAAVATGPQPSGGFPYTGYETKSRSREDVRREREELGIIPRRIVADVAARQAERLELDAQKQYEELSRELEVEGIRIEAMHLELLAIERERMIDAEIARRIKQRIEEQEILMLLTLVAAAI